MKSVTAKLVSSEGPWLEAVLAIGDERIHVMDDFSHDEQNCPAIGDEFEFEFDDFMLDDETWENIFSGNPDQRIGVEHISGWSYRCYGRIVQIQPVVADCGLFDVPDVVQTNDTRILGEFVAFTVSRLGGTVRHATDR